MVDSVTHKGLPYVVYEIVGQGLVRSFLPVRNALACEAGGAVAGGLVPCLVDLVIHKGLPYVN